MAEIPQIALLQARREGKRVQGVDGAAQLQVDRGADCEHPVVRAAAESFALALREEDAGDGAEDGDREDCTEDHQHQVRAQLHPG